MRKHLHDLAFFVVIADSRGIYRWRKLYGLQLQRSFWEGVTDGAWDVGVGGENRLGRNPSGAKPY